MAEILEVDDDCNITYTNGEGKSCPYRPHYTFADCEIGYGPQRGCPKYDYYHMEKS
jgi:hypothetical protein